jgi:hypothetical protein
MAVFFSRFPRQPVGHDELGATDARQGRWGRHVFWVLVISTALAVMALFGSWAFHSNGLQAANDRSTPTVEDARSAGADGPVRENPPPSANETVS